VFPSDPGIRYEFPVHEQVVSSLERQGRRLEELDVEILHDGYVDPAERERKQWRNLELFRARLERGEALGAMGRYLMGGCLWDLKRADLALEVYRVCLVEAQAEGRGDLAVACWVRIAGALWRLGRREEAREASRLMAAAGVQHPEALLLRVKLAFLDGDRVGAERLLGELVRVPDQVWLPPCDGGMVRMKAELWLIRGLLAGDGAGEFCEWLD
jgi:hypothetical protein